MIRSEADVARGLEALVALDPRLQKVVDIAGDVPLRQPEPGLRGLVATVVSQQVSKASAAAIFGRFAALVDPGDPAAILGLPDEAFRQAGFSGAKVRTVRAAAEAVLDGRLDLGRIGDIPSAEAVAELVVLPGIGVWTAECYLLFAAGHPDVFPVGDLALRVAVGHAFALPARPGEKATAEIAGAWSPHRSVAARLFWSYYHAVTNRDAAPAEQVAANAAEAEASQRRHDTTP